MVCIIMVNNIIQAKPEKELAFIGIFFMNIVVDRVHVPWLFSSVELTNWEKTFLEKWVKILFWEKFVKRTFFGKNCEKNFFGKNCEKEYFLEKIVKNFFWKKLWKNFFGKNICVLLRRANGGGLHTFGCFGNTSWPKHILRHEILKAWISCSSAFSHTPRLSLESLAIAILLLQDCSEQAPY